MYLVLPAQVWAADELTRLCGETVRIGVRADAAPFSFRTDLAPADSGAAMCFGAADGPLAGYAGFTVELCRRFAVAAEGACGGAAPPVFQTVEVAADGRDAAMVAAAPPFDLLCGSTTATISRAARLPSSPYTFVTGSVPLASERFLDGESCRIAVVGGTTSDVGARGSASPAAERDRNPEAWTAFVARNPHCAGKSLARPDHRYASYAEGVADLTSDAPAADVLIGDRHILAWHWTAAAAPARAAMTLLDNVLSIEPYAVMAPTSRGRLMELFSRFLARLQAGGAFTEMVDACFGYEVDRSLWRLIAFQKTVREGALLPEE